MTTKTQNIVLATIAIGVLGGMSLAGYATFENQSNAHTAQSILDGMTFEVIPSASAIGGAQITSSTTVMVGAYLEYTCWHGFVKCTTSTIYKDVGAGETFNTQALLPKIFTSLSDLEMHHTLTNNAGMDLSFNSQHWGTLQDYSEQASRICNDSVMYESVNTLSDGQTIDIRFCHMNDASENDMASWTIKIL